MNPKPKTLGEEIVDMLLVEHPTHCFLLTLDRERQLKVAEDIDHLIEQYNPQAMP